MANMLDTAAVRNIAKHRNKLMSLVETTKRRKANKKQKKWAVPPSNIEHLVFKKIPTSPPAGVGSPSGDALNGTAKSDDDYDNDEDEDERDDCNSGATTEDDSEREIAVS